MQKKLVITLSAFLALSHINDDAYAQIWSRIDTSGIVSRDTVKRGKYELVFINMSSGFSAQIAAQLLNTFFIIYPKQVKLYNRKSRTRVTFIIDPQYAGVAAAAEGIVRFNPEWFKRNPADIDVVTHECMHIVQSYPHRAGPSWITEGIADYIRFKMGLYNDEAGWKLPDFKESQKYTDSYRITARFFNWIESNISSGIIRRLDKSMRSGSYQEQFWNKETGRSVDELWKRYQNAHWLQQSFKEI